MKIIEMEIGKIKPYEKNPRKNDASVPKVMQSIKEFGFKVPLVIDKDNVIVTGHTRYKAAIKLGMTHVPVLIADDLTPEQIKAYRLADNKVSEFSVWDYELLAGELGELADSFDMGELGFSMDLEEMQHGWDEEEEAPEPKEKPERGYAICYELTFNNEQEQEEWYEFLGMLKRKFPDVDTIAERVLIAVRDWSNANGSGE